ARLPNRADRALAVRVAHLVGAAARARCLGRAVDARLRARRARRDAVGAEVRVAGARRAARTGAARAVAVADLVGAAGGPGRSVAEVQADGCPRLTADDAGLAWRGIGRAV